MVVRAIALDDRVEPRPNAGTNALVQRVRGKIGAARPDHGSRLRIYRDLLKTPGRPRLLEHRSPHSIEHIYFPLQAIGEGDMQHAVPGDGDIGYVRREFPHLSGSICISFSRARARRQFSHSSLDETRPKRGPGEVGVSP